MNVPEKFPLPVRLRVSNSCPPPESSRPVPTRPPLRTPLYHRLSWYYVNLAGPALMNNTLEARLALRFDRNELSGAFGDIGTDFPLLVSIILIAKLDTASVLIMFGLMQIFTGTFYRMPMPVQPLKAMAVLVLTQKLSGGGVFVGVRGA